LVATSFARILVEVDARAIDTDSKAVLSEIAVQRNQEAVIDIAGAFHDIIAAVPDAALSCLLLRAFG